MEMEHRTGIHDPTNPPLELWMVERLAPKQVPSPEWTPPTGWDVEFNPVAKLLGVDGNETWFLFPYPTQELLFRRMLLCCAGNAHYFVLEELLYTKNVLRISAFPI